MTYNSIEAITKQIQKLKKQMLRHAKNLEFEEAAHLRDEVRKLQEKELELRN